MIIIIQIVWLFIGTLIGQIIILFIGYTIIYFLPKNRNLPPLLKFAMSYGIGTGLICLSMFLCILIGFHSRISYLPILILTTFLFFYFKIWKILKDDIKKIFTFKNLRFNKIEIFCFVLFLIVLIYLFFYWLIYPIFYWDPQVLWDAKAKYFFFDGNLEYLSFLKDFGAWFHPSYPLLVPLNLTFFYSIFFQYHYFAKIIFVSYFFFLIVFIYYSLRFFKLNRTYSMLLSTLFAPTTIFFFHATSAHADLTLTFFYTISTIFLFYYFSTEEQHYLLYSSIFMGFMAWSKVEGIGLMGVNISILIFYHIFMLAKKRIDFKKSLKRVLIYSIISITIISPWLLFCLFNNIPFEYISNILEIFNLQRTLSKVGYIFWNLIIILLDFYNWNFLFWLVFIFILIINIKSIFKEKNFFLFILCLSPFLLYIFIQIISPYYGALQVSLDRQLLHLTPISCFFMGILFANDETKIIKIEEDSFNKIVIFFFIGIIILFIIVMTFFGNQITDLLREFFPFFEDIFG